MKWDWKNEIRNKEKEMRMKKMKLEVKKKKWVRKKKERKKERKKDIMNWVEIKTNIKKWNEMERFLTWDK